MKALYCPRCGSIIGPSSQFCQHCGHQLAINHTADSAIPPSYRGTQTDPRMQENLHLQKKSVCSSTWHGTVPNSDCGVITPPQPLGMIPVFNPNIPNMEVLRRWLPIARSIFKFSSTIFFRCTYAEGSDIGTVKPSNKVLWVVS